jgi:hypothetical protein
MWGQIVQSIAVLVLLTGPMLAKSSDEPLMLSSGERRVAMIELYTSEGCSSCPPADRWLSGLKSDPGLWKRFIPIAFHVDYWDYIGWSDRFARAEYGDRQHRYVAQDRARFVYTPGVFYNGREWRDWQRGADIESDATRVGNLTLAIDGDDIAVHFDVRHDNYGQLTVHVAILGMDLETRVKAGENLGRTLHHDFVALGVRSMALEHGVSGFKAITRLPESGLQPRDQAIVAWVSEAGSQVPIQAVGAYRSKI